MKSIFSKGDWVRFYFDNKLVIGVVQYTRRPLAGNEFELITDVGSILESMVLEGRMDALATQREMNQNQGRELSRIGEQ